MGIERKHLSREELEKEAIDYLSKKKPCTLATFEKDGWLRVSLVNYVNDGLTIYFYSEGEDKLKNFRKNNRVGIGIETGSKAMKSRGINIWGIAKVFDDEAPEFDYGMKVISTILKDMEKAAGSAI